MNSASRKDQWIKLFFASNAVTSIIILGLITIFKKVSILVNTDELERYKSMEYASVVTKQHDYFLYRYLENIQEKK